ncbi:MAG: hypothetical protein LBS69_09015 [Prevotellaceae bacterium]|jgi:hypothetical protein|nr:hypothetical protein [Prevotellaceae bacterium]
MITSDLYLVFPCTCTKGSLKDLSEWESFPQKRKGIQLSELAQDFRGEMKFQSKFEFDSTWSPLIERRNFGDIELVIKNDDRHNPEIIGSQAAFGIETHYAESDLSLFYVVVPNISALLTFILDQSSRREVTIRIGGEEIEVEKWLEKFGLHVTSKAYYCVCTSGLDANEARNIIASEAYYPESQMFINSKDVKQILDENIAQYTHYDCFASHCGTIYVMKEFAETYPCRLYSECLIMFILEIIILKISAIQLANKQVIEQIESYKNIGQKDMRDIFEQFSKSIHLWDTQHFRYFISQTLANRIEQSFGLNSFLEQYDRNRKLLEQLNGISSIIVDKRKSIMLSLLATMQLASISYSFWFYAPYIRDIPIPFSQWLSFALSSIIAGAMAYYFIFKKGK